MNINVNTKVIENESFRLKYAAEVLGKNLQDMSLECGFSPSYFFKIVSGERPISRGVLDKLYILYNLSASWLKNGSGEMFLHEKQQTVEEPNAIYRGGISELSLMEVPFYPARARATFSESFFDEPYEGEVIKVIVRPGASYKNCVAFEMNGDSMTPYIPDHSIVLAKEIDPNDWVYQVGHVYALLLKGNNFWIKRITENKIQTGEHVVLSSDNPLGGSISIPPAQILKMWRILRILDAEVN